jgi:hypothetical protein
MGPKRETLPRMNSDEDGRLACQRAWDACCGRGAVLPETRLAGGRAWPVVRWDELALQDRMARGAFAVVNRVKVRDWVVAAAGEVLPLAIQGFVFTGTFAQVQTPMSTLSPLGRMVWLSNGADDWCSWSCELGGFWQVDARTDEIVTGGSAPPELPAAVGAVGRRLLVEQLFDLAARGDCLPVSI